MFRKAKVAGAVLITIGGTGKKERGNRYRKECCGQGEKRIEGRQANDG